MPPLKQAPCLPINRPEMSEIMSSAIPDFLPTPEVRQSDRELPQRRDPRRGAQKQAHPPKPADITTEAPTEVDGTVRRIGNLIDVRA